LPSAAGAVHRSTVRRPSGQSGGRGGPECLSGCLPCFGRLSAYSVASTRPVSGVRCDRPVSAMRRPRSVVQCPVWTSGVPRQCPRVPASASAVSAPVTSWSASVRRAATRSEGPGAGRPGRIRERLDRLPEPAWLRVRDCLASHRTGSSGWSRRLRSVVIVGGPRASRRASESLPGWTAAYARGRSAAANCSERRPLDAGDALTCWFGGGGEGI
jgi:hypothetical protein